MRSLDENGEPLVLTTKEVQEGCNHEKRHVASFCSRMLVCDKCNKHFDRYGQNRGKQRNKDG